MIIIINILISPKSIDNGQPKKYHYGVIKINSEVNDMDGQSTWISPRAKLENLIQEYRVIYGPMTQAQAIKAMRAELQQIANGSILIK